MKPMNWEPMTEEAVFEDGTLYLIYTTLHDTLIAMYSKGHFVTDCDGSYHRQLLSHFCRITNPNNTTKETKP